MDTARGFDDGRVGDGEGLRADGGGHDVLDAALASPPDDGGDIDGGGVDDAAFSLGGDERRMHVRAYNHWVSLLKGRPCPGIDDLDPANIADFGPHSVLIDFTRGIDDPTIAYLGRTLREECGLDAHVVRVADVPGRSLLSRLTDHYLQIIANRAPIGFEAEFVGIRGRTTLYRGILMPFTSDDSTIDFIYGVINWKELADADTQATLAAELDAAVRSARARSPRRRCGRTGRAAGSRRRRNRSPSPRPTHRCATGWRWRAKARRRCAPPMRAGAPRCIARWAAPMISRWRASGMPRAMPRYCRRPD